MYCEKCNIDFPEGLRYCKWCGQTLTAHRRVTSELQSCPACAAAIQPGWAFCKSCGGKLTGAAREPLGAVCPRCGSVTDPGALHCLRCGEDLAPGRGVGRTTADGQAGTALIAQCPSCGEQLDTASAYCKSCGASVTAESSPFGASSMLCRACNSYSPVGSGECRVCGAAFASPDDSPTVRVGAEKVEKKSSTLPDLAEHLPEVGLADQPQITRERASSFEDEEVVSGAHTLVFGDPASARPLDAATESGAAHAHPKGGAQTTVLPGVAGSSSEQPSATSAIEARATTRVDDEESEEVASQGALADDLPSRLQTPAELEEIHPQHDPQSMKTFVFGSEPAPADVAAPPLEAQLEAQPHDRRAEVDTAPFALRQQPPANELTTELQPAQFESKVTRVTEAPSLPVSAEPAIVAAPPAKKKSGALAIAALIAVIVIGAGVYLGWRFMSGSAEPTPQPEAPAEVSQPAPAPAPAPTTPQPPPVAAAPEGMVLVAAGTYKIGRDDGDALEKPAHTVDLPAFFIDRTEVTNAAYKKFVDATGHKAPANWKNGLYPDGRDNFPVTGVSWQDAADYAAWAGKRLATEAEWETAARGTDGRIYPWGNEWQASNANIGLKPNDPKAEQYPAEIKEVGQYPQGASSAGALDMIGNVWEWTADKFALYPGNKMKTDYLNIQPGVSYRIIRGGAYDCSKIHDASYRGLLDASQPYPKVGFRCVKDAR